jgi:hypothetical protein
MSADSTASLHIAEISFLFLVMSEILSCTLVCQCPSYVKM